MSSSTPFRLLKRLRGYALQIGNDLSWHKRMSSVTHRSLLARVLEQTVLLVNNAICAEDYYHLGLAAENMSMASKRTFLGSFEKWRYFNLINPPVYDVLARDKALFHLLAHSADLPTPATLATTAPGRKPYFGMAIERTEDLRAFLLTPTAENLFFKPADGSLGEGALSIGEFSATSNTWELLPEKTAISLDELIDRLTVDGKLARALIQERLRPHPAVASILPDVCPTVRFMTLLTNNGVEHLGAALRIGSGRGPTDNLAGGGLLAPIDLDTGNVLSAISLARDIPEHVKAHPVTKAAISATRIPNWNELKALVDRSALAFNFLPCIGWDIGITERGPVIIEINTRPRCISVQSARPTGLLDTAFGAELSRISGFLDSGIRRPTK